MLWVLIRIASATFVVVASLQSPRLEAILMSTHNIGSYEEMVKIIFQLSTNITKFALYIFFCGLPAYHGTNGTFDG